MKLNEDFEASAGIYIIKNLINGKFYIGESLNIKKRIYQHIRSKTQPIHKAIQKYGLENFEIEIRYFENLSKSDLLDLEEQLIIEYNSIYPNGYNICSKGIDNSGCHHSNETKRKISKALKGTKRTSDEIIKSSKSRTGSKRTPEQIRNISNAHKGIVYGPCSEETKQKIKNALKERYKTIEHPSKGYKHTQEFKDKLSLSKKGKSNLLAKRPILQIDANTDEVLKEWESTVDAVVSLFNNKSKASCISAALAGRYKTAFGFKWRFKYLE